MTQTLFRVYILIRYETSKQILHERMYVTFHRSMRRRLKVAQSHVFRSATVSVSGISKHAYCINILGTHLPNDVKNMECKYALRQIFAAFCHHLWAFCIWIVILCQLLCTMYLLFEKIDNGTVLSVIKCGRSVLSYQEMTTLCCYWLWRDIVLGMCWLDNF